MVPSLNRTGEGRAGRVLKQGCIPRAQYEYIRETMPVTDAPKISCTGRCGFLGVAESRVNDTGITGV